MYLRGEDMLGVRGGVGAAADPDDDEVLLGCGEGHDVIVLENDCLYNSVLLKRNIFYYKFQIFF